LKNILLLILDGWGHAEPGAGNVIELARTPHMDRFYRQYPFALLDAAGEAVGLPAGQMGNSEVGHLNLGAGRVVYQELTRISRSIRLGEFYGNKVLLETMERVRNGSGALHLVGLVSDGGVHSHIEHLLGLLEMARRQEVKRLFIHAILDGRDTIPFGAGPFLAELERFCRESGRGAIATVCGRYYAMDRDQRWDRVKRAYVAYTRGEGLQSGSALEALAEAYGRGEGDEFVQPTVISGSMRQPVAKIGSEDSIIFFNFRPDRMRQLSRTFIDQDFEPFERGENPPLPYCVAMTEYDRARPVPVAFTAEDIRATLGEVYAGQGLAQARIAETEKYAHVTFFFSGGREAPFALEDRILIPSPKVATYDLQPEMSAPEVARKIIECVARNNHRLVVANFANADMVGHTGDIKAATKAVETVDSSLGLIEAQVLSRGWAMIVTADHGNAELMLGGAGETLTAHSANPVPFVLVGSEEKALRPRGILADVAPTVLALAGLEKPPAMTGSSLLTDSLSRA